MTKFDGRRRRYVPLHTHVAFSPFGTRLIEKWGAEGIGIWALLLAAAKRETVEGTFEFTSDVEAWGKLGATADRFTLTEFFKFCGDHKQTRKRRSGRVTYVEITGWGRWNRQWRDPKNPSTEATNADEMLGNAVDLPTGYEPNASPEAEAEVEAEVEVEAEAKTGWNGLPISAEKDQELSRIKGYLNNADDTTMKALRRAAQGCSFGSIVRVRESVQNSRKSVGVGYAVQALRKEAEEAA